MVRGYNLELRAPDATASPYLVLGALIRAGLQGIREKLEAPHALEVDPGSLTAEERVKWNVLPLPGSLTEALDLMDADPVVRSWMPAVMYDSYVSVKRLEVELMAGLDPAEVCERYARVY